MVKDASGRSDFEFLSDLRDGGGVAILADGDREKFVDALLPGSEIGKHGTSILKIILVYNIPITRRLINVAISLIYQVFIQPLRDPEQRLGIHTNPTQRREHKAGFRFEFFLSRPPTVSRS